MAVIASLRALEITDVNLLRYHVEWMVVLSGDCYLLLIVAVIFNHNCLEPKWAHGTRA